MRRALLIVGIILSSLSGCDTVPSHPVLPLPPALTLPHIPEPDLQCLTDDVYRRLIERDAMLQARVKTLEGIIRSTHQ